ncbi:hypothetical protein [Candidatus Chrysopegis kryptomonas]|uniref:Uncharacterized protein n=1 Tax=Candidatus Chryseopegocella kryptomonas TaxID=1633643 RepID=A0A0P1MNL3_9BACT|nr:hypothetical protein [Candidatus Chrysopegis kryptomonas]CUS97070.1 hypothetical protein JGI23_00234 [Candidatus Chrysopegis kryptomonas]
MVDLFPKLILIAVIPLNFLFSQTVTNFEIIDSLINSIISEISQEIKTNKIKVQSNLQDKLIENRILNALLKNFSVYLDTDDETKNLLRFDAFKSKISYVEEKSGFLKTSKLKRVVEVNLFYSLIENGSVKFSGDLKREFHDYINFDEIAKIEDRAFDFTKGEIIVRKFNLQKITELF